MISKSAAHTVFAIPELAFTICEYLALRDLNHFACVSKDWYQYAESLPWRHFRPCLDKGAKLSPQATKALVRNLPRIRSIELKCYEYRVLSPLTLRLKPGISVRVASKLCTNLKRFNLECHANVHYLKLPPITKLLNHNLQLTHLTLPFVALTMNDSILTAIPNLKRLRHLTLESIKMCPGTKYPYDGTPTIPLLLQACLPLPELIEMHLDFDMVWRDTMAVMQHILIKALGSKGKVRYNPDLKAIFEEAAIARFCENRTASKI
ncbi:hypothetical protein BGZ68_005604, partial [Mortierella alpina]